MNLKQAETYWKTATLENMRASMAGSSYQIQRKPISKGYDYCVAHYVAGSKVGEYWPSYRSGIRHRADLTAFGEAFEATESMSGGFVE